MQKTTNYGLNKPETTDFYDVADQNANMDVIDEKLKEIDDGKLSTDGGTLKGALNLTTLRVNSTGDQSFVQFMKNWVTTGYIGVNGINNPVFIDADASKIFKLYGEHNKPTAEDVGALPITGGTLNGTLYVGGGYGRFNADSTVTLIRAINNASDETTYRQLILRTSESVGDFRYALVIGDVVNGVFSETKEIFGSHNKPIGSYTGNGNNSVRTINTNGLGNAILIWDTTKDVTMIVSAGAFGKVGTTFKAISGENASFRDGILTLITSDEALNANGVVYSYQVL